MNNESTVFGSPFKKVSILITSYNKLEFLNSAEVIIETAAEKGCEIVIVDDGSTDGSALALRNIAIKTNNLKLIEQTNQGSASARNTALASATREYVVFLDFDDVLNFEVLEKCLEAMDRHDAPFGYSNYSTFPNNAPNVMQIRVENPEIIELGKYRNEIYDSMGYWRYVYRRAFLKKEKLEFKPTFTDVGGLFILDDMFWLLHNSSLDTEILLFPEDWVLYQYFAEQNPSAESWLRFQKQVLLLPRALELFIDYLETCDHTHEMSWLVPKIQQVMEAHLKFLNFSQLISVLPSYLQILSNQHGFFFRDRKPPKIKLILILVTASLKNSALKALSKYHLGELFLKGYRIVKK